MGGVARRSPPFPMDVRFREVDPFNCWIWLHFADQPGGAERGYVETALDSWFFLGKLGAFNAENLQTHEGGVDLGWLAYDTEAAERCLPALMHNMGPMEYQDDWRAAGSTWAPAMPWPWMCSSTPCASSTTT